MAGKDEASPIETITGTWSPGVMPPGTITVSQ